MSDEWATDWHHEALLRQAEVTRYREALDQWTALGYLAWGVIANAGWDGHDKSEGWQEAAVHWRDQYHGLLAERDSPALSPSSEKPEQ